MQASLAKFSVRDVLHSVTGNKNMICRSVQPSGVMPVGLLGAGFREALKLCCRIHKNQ